jgi:GNAT superfamily N-acetyltransferase
MLADTSDLVVRSLAPSDQAAFVDLMEPGGCFCQFWDFEGDKNAWLERCSVTPEHNRDEACSRIAAGDPSFVAIAAFAQDLMVGFCRLAHAPTKVRRLSVYRAVPNATFEDALTLTCFYVRSETRKQGIARALLNGAIAEAKRAGVGRLIALPRVSPPMVHDEEGQFGPPSIFAEFRELVAGPHPVLELRLP